MIQLIHRILTIFLSMQFFIYSSTLLALNEAAIQGEIISIVSKEAGTWEVLIKSNGEEKSFILDESSWIKKEVPVEDIKKGDHLAGASFAGTKGLKGNKAPFRNLSPAAKKMLGLPNIGEIPSVPKIPKIPKKSEMTGSPTAKRGPVPENQGAETPPAPQNPEPEVKTQDQLLEEKGFQNPKLLSSATEEGPESTGGEVTRVKKQGKKYELTVMNPTGQPEKLVFEQGHKITKSLTPNDLKKNDQVELKFSESGQLITELLVR